MKTVVKISKMIIKTLSAREIKLQTKDETQKCLLIYLKAGWESRLASVQRRAEHLVIQYSQLITHALPLPAMKEKTFCFFPHNINSQKINRKKAPESFFFFRYTGKKKYLTLKRNIVPAVINPFTNTGYVSKHSQFRPHPTCNRCT